MESIRVFFGGSLGDFLKNPIVNCEQQLFINSHQFPTAIDDEIPYNLDPITIWNSYS